MGSREMGCGVMTDLTDQQIDEMLQRVKRWSWPRQYGKSVIVDLVNAITSLLAAKKEAVARAQKAEAEVAEGTAEWSRMTSQHHSLIGERDALAARLASAEAKLAKVEEALWCFHFIEGNPLQADGLAVVERVRAALASDTTPEPTSDLADVLGLTDEQREEHARQLAEAFARIRACER